MTPTAEEMRKLSENPYLRAETDYAEDIEAINIDIECEARRGVYRVYIDVDARQESMNVLKDYYSRKGYKVTIESSCRNEKFLVIDWSDDL